MQNSETSLINHKPDNAFSMIFWRKIKEDMRMDVLVEKKPKQKLKLYEISEEDLNINLNAVRGWSEDNHNIYYQLRENGFADFICNKESLVQNYTQLIFDKERITQMDPLLNKFDNLTLLRLNKNRITFVENLPPNLKELHLYSNPIYLLSNKMRQEQLLYLGLGYCLLNDQAIENISKKLPNLVCLDLTHNNLCDLEGTIENIKMLTKIKILSLYGNPFVFLPQYFQSIVDSLVSLKYFDEQKADDIKNRILQAQQAKIAAIQAEIKRQQEEQLAKEADLQKAQDKNKKGAKPVVAPKKDEKLEIEQQPIRVQTSPSEYLKTDNDIKMQFKDSQTFTITVNIQTLENLDGILLDKYTYLEMEQKPELFQTRYWLGYKILDTDIITEEKCLMYENATLENEKGRIDFEHQFEIVCKATVEVRDFIEKGFIVTIYQEQPAMVYNEEGDKKPDLNSDNFPKQEKSILGICKVELDWLRSQNKDTCQKYRLFPDKTQMMSELIHPYDNEKELIDSKMEFINGEIKKQEDIQKQIIATNEAKKDVGKGGLKGKEVKKKDDKKQPKKGKETEPEKKQIQNLNWQINERMFVYANEKKIARSNKQLLAVRVVLGF